MAVLRTFFSLPASPVVQQSMQIVQKQLQEASASVKWETASQLHITLKFLGDVESTRCENLSQSIADVLKSFTRFSITYEGLGAFPDIYHPRILWAGIQPSNVLRAMQFAMEETCASLGFPKETRTFHPHITLGRVKGINNIHRLTEAIKTSTFEPLQVDCPEVCFMKSDLHPDGAVYTTLETYILPI